MKDKHDDNSFIQKLYKAGAKESSPKELDQLILNQAKSNCEPTYIKNNNTKKNWLYGLSTAAALVFGFFVIFNSQNINDQVMQPTTLEETIKNSPKREKQPLPKAATQTIKEENKLKPSNQSTAPSGVAVAEKIKPANNLIEPEPSPISPIINTNPIINNTENTVITVDSPSAPESITNSSIPISESTTPQEQSDTERVEERLLSENEAAGNLEEAEYSSMDEDDEDKVELERVVTTGAHIRAKDLTQLNESIAAEINTILESNATNKSFKTLKRKLNKITNYIQNERDDKIYKLIEDLKSQFPNVDFRDLEELLKEI